MGVVGEFNQNLKELEKITNSSIYSRGNSILIKSTPEKNEILPDRCIWTHVVPIVHEKFDLEKEFSPIVVQEYKTFLQKIILPFLSLEHMSFFQYGLPKKMSLLKKNLFLLFLENLSSCKLYVIS